jgi:hypothetical protein
MFIIPPENCKIKMHKTINDITYFDIALTITLSALLKIICILARTYPKKIINIKKPVKPEE